MPAKESQLLGYHPVPLPGLSLNGADRGAANGWAVEGAADFVSAI